MASGDEDGFQEDREGFAAANGEGFKHQTFSGAGFGTLMMRFQADQPAPTPQVASSRGITHLPARFKDNWLQAVDAAVAANDSSLAVVSLERLVGKEAWLEALRARGYEITEP